MVEKGPTALLARFASELAFESIPPEVVQKVKLYIMDTIGCGIFGSRDPRNKILVKVLQGFGLSQVSTVWGTELKASPADAALANGTFVHSLDFDDQCQEVGLHAGACTVPAAIGVAEYLRDVDGKRLITSCLAGYEVSIRAGSAFGLEPVRRGWHPAGFNGTFGAAAAAGRMLGLDEDKMVHAFGLAATQGAGLMSVQYGSDAKGMHAGKASQSGVYAAALARDGFKGILNVLEIPYGGYVSTLADKYDLSKITEGLGERFMVSEKLALKAYPGVRMTHVPIEVTERIVSENSVKAGDVDRIIVRVTAIAKDHVGWDFKAEGVTSALSNIAFGVAVVLVKGAASPVFYKEEVINDPMILEMTKKVLVEVDEEMEKKEPYGMGATVIVRLKNGKTLTMTIANPKGTPSLRPMSLEDAKKKFRSLVGDDKQSEDVISLVDGLEGLRNCSELARTIGAVKPANEHAS